MNFGAHIHCVQYSRATASGIDQRVVRSPRIKPGVGDVSQLLQLNGPAQGHAVMHTTLRVVSLCIVAR